MKYDVEQLLQQALSPSAEPSPWLNKKIVQTAKENENMKKRNSRIPSGAAIAVLTLIIASLGVFAGWKYLAPEKVAKEVFADEALSKAFETENAIFVNETQEYDGYKITLLGIVSGKGLSEYTEWDENGNIEDDKTYVITAIENADGTPRPDVSDEAYGEDTFYVSPYIQGLSMIEYNAHTLGGGYSEDIVDGIQYRIMVCDNIEMFAHRGLYIGVNNGISPQPSAFLMDETTGEITRNETYEGVNALFELPIPAFKGDEAAVEAYLKEMEAKDSEEAEMPEESDVELDEITIALQKTQDWKLEDFQANAECVYEEELTSDENYAVSYSYELEDGSGSDGTQWLDHLFEEKKIGEFVVGTVFGDEDICFETFEMLEDGDVMLRVYVM